MRFARPLALAASLFVLSQAASAAEVTPGTKLAAKQELVRGNGTEPATLDPGKMEGVPEANLAYDLFDGLVNTDPDGKIVAGTAEKWETKDGGRTWIFTLRKDARWSDGTPVTAADFEFAWKRVTDPKNASPYMWFTGQGCHIVNGTDIAQGRKSPDTLGVKAINDKTLQVQLDEPIGFFLKTLTHSSMLPVPKK
uniref:peptide ABC transporter substrate-binding protein n=1 Tax=Paraburkholderia sp. TaxID=1926495 RepID=UPI00286EF93B